MRYYCRTFHAGESSFPERVEELIRRAAESAGPNLLLRLVFFTDAARSDEYAAQTASIKERIGGAFPVRTPLWSLVAQAPLAGDGHSPVLEAHYYAVQPGQRVHYKNGSKIPYIVIEDDASRELFLSAGPHNLWLPDYIPAQPEFIFDHIRGVMGAERFPVESIQRQWNYIEGITAVSHGCQHYQAFNDARSEFYADAAWENGYPAATGIGTTCGGVMVEINAAVDIASLPVDNPLQRAAHNYTERVLLPGEKAMKTTPKFERARVLGYDSGALFYLSGTAAIRREASLAEQDSAGQTSSTIENIDALIRQTGMPFRIDSGRVYVKHPETVADVERVVRRSYPDADMLFVQSDVCRHELLVEIEGIGLPS